MATTEDQVARDVAVMDAEAIVHLRAALTSLRDAQSPPSLSGSRDRAIAITHVEDALLRLSFGSPPDQP